ncbi:MAG TPA: TIGR03619 family F420-dependent LLM class oxidoreductase [Streptosporangiaceae bacterium]|nr:TIGR03619 family F420-dependent LLM class oxidoreductase [Streptosporangiaceae bacterium]
MNRPQLFLGAGFQPPGHLLPVAALADETGFDGVALPDHVANPVRIDTHYPGTADGSTPWELDSTPWPDPWVGLTAVAAATRRLHVMTHIMVLPMRNVFLTAKMVGTVAAMFPGRVHLGVGVGWMPEEFALLDSDFHTRGARTEEMVAVLRALWGEQPASFSGKHHSFESVAMFPVPSVPVPIYGSGSSEAALDRAARVMDGFVAMPCSVDEIENDLMPALRARLGRYGRSISDFHVNVIPAQVGPDDLRRLADLGVTSVQVHPFARDQALHAPLPDKLDAVRRWADRVLTGREPQDEA